MKVGEYSGCVAKTGAGLVKVAKADRSSNIMSGQRLII